MRKLINLPEPDNRLKTSLITTLVLLILSSMWIFYDLYAYLGMRANPVPEEFPDNGLGIGIIIRLVLYASFAFMMFYAFKSGLKTSTLTVICAIREDEKRNKKMNKHNFKHFSLKSRM